ncbi:MAG: thiosulfate sulfurtransferase [Chromatiales bacterium]|jgi:rhodanese-related sulfurtransferase|nr:thiosulfate sulfurtransferase [Chromatiales bacterium]
MSPSVATTSVGQLKAALHDGEELALLDAREEVPFDSRHLLMASCVPLGQLEMVVDGLVPRRDTRVVWCDDGEGLAAKAAARMAGFGYTNVFVLEGDVAAWESAGHPVYSGIHVPSKAFAEVVEHEAHTPWISVEDLQARIDARNNMVILDSRSYEEYHANSIPGAISVPGAELVYRFKDLVPDEATEVVVNCGGRTRSIIGAQALINAGFSNPIVSLKNGTQDWHLAGYQVVVGADRRPPPVSLEGIVAAKAGAQRVAAHFGTRAIDGEALETLRRDSDTYTLFVLDVRTPEEFEAGHLPGTRPAPGGQLVQETDTFLGVWGARVVLVDTDGVRATMTASWLAQMGWHDVVIHMFDADAPNLEKGPYRPTVLGDRQAEAIDAEGADALIRAGAQVVDVGASPAYKKGHIPGAWFALRSRLSESTLQVPEADMLIVTSEDGVAAQLAAQDISGTDRFGSIVALTGGTQAWVAAGFPVDCDLSNLVDSFDDSRLKARESAGDIEEAMRAYLSWEIELVNQMAADDDHRFKVSVP